jgi:hypothetical protein
MSGRRGIYGLSAASNVQINLMGAAAAASRRLAVSCRALSEHIGSYFGPPVLARDSHSANRDCGGAGSYQEKPNVIGMICVEMFLFGA